jgi:hypothetical protein
MSSTRPFLDLATLKARMGTKTGTGGAEMVIGNGSFP